MKSALPVGISMSRKILLSIDSKRGDIPRSKYVVRILEKTLHLEKDRTDLVGQNGIETSHDQFQKMQKGRRELMFRGIREGSGVSLKHSAI
jgi:hypothetical protein